MSPEDPYPFLQIDLQSTGLFNPNLPNESLTYLIGTFVFLVFLIACSALFSASENALFSLSSKDKEDIKALDSPPGRAILNLLSQPKKLLATILIGNSFVNVAFVIVSAQWLNDIFNPNMNEYLDFAIKVIIVTLVLLLFGEVVPKVYATKNNKAISRLMAIPIIVCQKLFGFLVVPMVRFTSIIDRKVKIHEHTVSADELTHAIDITSDKDTGEHEKEILKGIVNFGNKTVTQIMKGRVDVASLDSSIPYDELLRKVNELGYSRLPVYEETFDNILGVLYIKELLPHLYESADFKWTQLLKPPFYVPENKRIDLLLSEFQEERMHMAIVVDDP